MSNEQLLTMLQDLEAVRVAPDGVITDGSGDEWTTEQINDALTILEETMKAVAQLRKIVAWADKAPMKTK